MSVESRARPWNAASEQGRIAVFTRHRTVVWVAGLVLLFVGAFLVRYWLARQIVSPWILKDEYVYAQAARDASTAGLTGIFDSFPTTYPGIYPRLISPAWVLFDSAGTPYAFAKAINALLMTAAVAFVFFWGRRFLASRYALLAAGLTMALPPLLYSGTLMTENAFFPGFVLSLLAIALALEKPTVLRQLAVFVPIAFTWLVRVQAIMLLAIIPLAVGLLLVLESRTASRGFREALRTTTRFVPWAVVYLVGGIGYPIYAAIRGKPLHDVLGTYYGVAEVDYSVRGAIEWITYHFGELMLLVAVIPASALIVLCGLALRRGADTTAAERAFLAVAVPAVLILPAQVGVFSSRFAYRVEERNMFHIAPVLLLAFALWLQRGLPRPQRLAGAAAVVPIALLLTLPLERLLNISLMSDTFSFIPFYEVSVKPSGGLSAAQLLLALGALVAGLAFITLPRRVGAIATPALVAGALVVLSVWASRGIEQYAVNFRVGAGAGDDVSWIDRHVGSDANVAAVYGGDADPDRARSNLLHTWFWNRSLKVVFKTVGVDLLSLPQHNASVGADGVLAPNPPRDVPDYVVADLNTPVAGTEIARTGSHILYRVEQPLRLAGRTDGLYGDGWMSNSASRTVFWTPSGKPGKVRVVISRVSWSGPDVPGNVRITVQRPGATAGTPPLASASMVLNRREERAFTLKAPAPPYQVVVGIDPTFSPSQFGLGDPRQLGAQVSFTPLAR